MNKSRLTNIIIQRNECYYCPHKFNNENKINLFMDTPENMIPK